MRILPVCQPLVTVYPEHAYLLSALNVNAVHSGWFLSHFIQLYMTEIDHINPAFYDFYFPERRKIIETHPCLVSQSTDIAYLQKEGRDLVAYLIEHIELGYYVFLYLDEYHIPETRSFQNMRFSHSILIYGYDAEKKQFSTGGFYRNSKFSWQPIGFETLSRAFFDNPTISEYERKVYFFKAKETQSFPFDARLVQAMLSDLLHSENTSYRNSFSVKPVRGVFGLDVYDHFVRELLCIKDGEEKFDLKSIRALFVFLEHKSCMLGRLEYLRHRHLAEIDGYANAYDEMRKKLSGTIHLMLKYLHTSDSDLIDRVIKVLMEDVKESERRQLESLLKNLTLEPVR